MRHRVLKMILDDILEIISIFFNGYKKNVEYIYEN